jgi:hypothetical protein
VRDDEAPTHGDSHPVVRNLDAVRLDRKYPDNCKDDEGRRGDNETVYERRRLRKDG